VFEFLCPFCKVEGEKPLLWAERVITKIIKLVSVFVKKKKLCLSVHEKCGSKRDK
jgi:hypothetical protein